jgi:FkbM family methyltransferase
MKATSTYVDAGAHAGTLLKRFVRLAPEGTGYAFEPIPSLCKGLRKRFPGLVVEQVALGANPGLADFHYLVDDPANSSLLHRDDREHGRTTRVIQVEVRRLDDCIPEGAGVDFIKIDVEGSEYDVLQGAERILTVDQPVIVLEAGSLSLERNIQPYLARFGYRTALLSDYLARNLRPDEEVSSIARRDGEFYFVAFAERRSST